MLKDNSLLIRLDNNTRDHLDYVAKEFGVSKADCIRMLINDEYRYFTETKKYLKDMDRYYKQRSK